MASLTTLRVVIRGLSTRQSVALIAVSVVLGAIAVAVTHTFVHHAAWWWWAAVAVVPGNFIGLHTYAYTALGSRDGEP